MNAMENLFEKRLAVPGIVGANEEYKTLPAMLEIFHLETTSAIARLKTISKEHEEYIVEDMKVTDTNNELIR